MKFIILISSIMLLNLFPHGSHSLEPSISSDSKIENPYIKLAMIKNSRNMSIDDYVNKVLEQTNASPVQVLQKAEHENSWLYKAFIFDERYMSRMHKMHVKLNKEYDSSTLQSVEYFKELEEKFPFFAKLLPILSSPKPKK